MRNLFIAFISLLTVTLVSCTDGNIGPSIIDTRATVIEDSSFVITGTTVLNNHVQARTSTQLLGIVNSKGYGTLTSDVVSQFMPAATIDTLGVSHDLIDSCRLTLRLPSDG
ncbi:MAG: DUF4270 family protein, partial [Muribaculaceae bacterium]|nr:DUF4270 family protein [Muribaculaceae bacterium]